MNRFKRIIAKVLFKDLLPVTVANDASSGGSRETANNFIKRVTYKTNDDNDFEDPDFDLESIEEGYNTDSYIRQGVDKYVDQIFKEGYMFYGNDPNVVDYLKMRLAYMAEATGTPTYQFLVDIAEDLMKFGNCMVVKSRSNDQNVFPQGVNITGLNGADPIAGYFCANPISMTVKRDKNGTVQQWQQETDAGTQTFKPEDIVHFYYKRSKGNAYGTSFLVPVLDDVRALRQAEENVLKMMYRNIYPFYHVKVGTEDSPGSEKEVETVIDAIDSMDAEGGLVTTERVTVTPIASNLVINADPYLQYLENRVFSGMGIPAIMFGRGNTANRSTGDNMTSEMADRIRAISKVIEVFFNEFIVKELLMEGGYDPLLNPDQRVEIKFNDNDTDVKIKKEVHAIYKYEHNAISENEMRQELGMDPIEDAEREFMFVNLITRENMELEAELDAQAASESETGTKETNNKQKNSGGKTSSKSSSSSSSSSSTKKKDSNEMLLGFLKDSINNYRDKVDKYIDTCYDSSEQITQKVLNNYLYDCVRDMKYTVKSLDFEEDVADRIIQTLLTDSLKLQDNIHKDLIGSNTYSTKKESLVDMINIRIDIFTTNLVKSIKEV